MAEWASTLPLAARTWLAGSQQSQGDYDAAVAQFKAANPGLTVKYVDMTYRMGHVLAPED